jgi:hypothetical protein
MAGPSGKFFVGALFVESERVSSFQPSFSCTIGARTWLSHLSKAGAYFF